ncbi:MAG: hypothetical protein QOE92_532 [Chloroflexota bacterium]|jgi:uncharacterized glyoxalase superfamily protein PhnB|nr:hypothetical protein [Chloroflexota bacterium]
MRFIAVGTTLLAVALAGCGSSNITVTMSSPSPAVASPGAATPSASPVNPNAVAFNVKVTGSEADPAELKTVKGKEITLTITTDKDEEVHLHGYDISFDCQAGMPLTKTFTADKTGTFEFELEESATHLGNLIVNPS